MNNFIKTAKDLVKEFLTESKKAINDLKSIKTIKKQIPNMFTFSRLILVPFIVTNIVMGDLVLAGILTASAAATDCVDGFLARKLKVTSEFGAKLDAVIDKIFVVSVALPLAVIHPLLLLPIALDGIIASINGYAHLKGYNPKTSSIGKKKTVALDALVSSSFFTSIPVFVPITIILYATSIVLQIKTGKEYYNMLLANQKKTKENSKTILASNEGEANEIHKTVEFERQLSEKEILEYCKEQCCNPKDENKDKQMIINKK